MSDDSRDEKDVDWYVNRFMLFMVVVGITGFVLFGGGIVPLIVTCLGGGVLLIVTAVWAREVIGEKKR